MSISLLREHIREMLSLLLSEDASTDGMSVGAADTAGMAGTTGTTGTKGTSGTSGAKKDDKKNPIKKVLPQVQSVAKAMTSPLFQNKAAKLGTMKGASLAKGMVAVGNAAETATTNAIQNRAEKNNAKVIPPPAGLVRNLKIQDANREFQEAQKAAKADAELASTGQASSTDNSSDKIKAVSDNAMKVATGQQKPK